ncbi:universal stress protein [Knoellia subterranea]|uniref:UspA domain-containing protein n=1 Tax=Knoellia subterranea KCTC 19937 TaxID=1385521 RepID=A0A0A0JL16_9MICO|nr:universal stress protein [Knoellia subterranea]KGN37808.1 hypothetical protein N803_12170 [Knoellia subterranea KCTC 19937]
MSTNASPARVVVAVDGTSSGAAVEWATRLASERGRTLHLVHVRVPFVSQISGAPVQLLDDGLGEAILRESVEHVRELQPGLTVTMELGDSPIAPVIVEASRDAELVVVGARGRGPISSALLGSTSVDVAAHAHAPVVVVRSNATDTATATAVDAAAEASTARNGVVVGSDGSAVSEAAIGVAFAEADARGVPLTVVHTWALDIAESAWVSPGYDQVQKQIRETEAALAAETVAGWTEKYPDVHVRTVVRHGHPVETIAGLSLDAELVVVGSRGRGGFSGLLLGSVSQGVLHHAHCPVMVVRPEDGAS